MKANIDVLDVQDRLKKWAEVTALTLDLLEASLKKQFPNLSEEELRRKLIDRLNAFRQIRPQEG